MIEILTSGVALGVHVPGLLLADRLRERGVPARVTVLERLLPEEKLATTRAMKAAFHRDFRAALVGQRVASNPGDAVSDSRVDSLFAEWAARGARRFVVFSGYWLSIVERYASSRDDVQVHVCHVDSTASPSFRGVSPPGSVWLADADQGTLPLTIPVSHEPPVPWSERSHALLLHGGGWGMGTYLSHASELLTAGFELDVVAHEESDAVLDDPGVRYHLIDPSWHPWIDDGYPPFGRLRHGSRTSFARGTGHHSSFDLMRVSMAAVSKPGGGTLLDSLWSATPLAFLEPFGAHEQRNSELWQRLGFGITLDAWRAQGCSSDVLASLHEALLGVARTVPDLSSILTSGES
ncbi:hypothetical protein FKR81_33705 [Lentzea tibetensis]|uniref:UDP-glucuronosyltransferase n=1 Tax=Lentzea tibetensis TaxID=2591470 RepID=A0A563EL59_9PSEU|nr:hypothetical protein [Lentzea tibetensis]TWP47007.1 hypothetical protein FKR81_33705 [Lentzea tibetensis]